MTTDNHPDRIIYDGVRTITLHFGAVDEAEAFHRTLTPAALPTPEDMLLAYMQVVRANQTVAAVAQADVLEIREEVVEHWENSSVRVYPPTQDELDALVDHLYAAGLVAARAAILICQAETGDPR